MRNTNLFQDDSEIEICNELIKTLHRQIIPLLVSILVKRKIKNRKAVIEAFMESTFCCEQSKEITEIIATNDVQLVREKFIAFLQRAKIS